MRGVVDHRLARAPDRRGKQVRVLEQRPKVLVPDDDERPRRDLAQAPDRRRLEVLDRRARPVVVHVGPVHVEEQVAQLLAHVALRPVRSVEPQVHLRLVEGDVVAGFFRRVDLLEQRVVLRPVRLTARPGIDEDQLRYALGVVEREVERKGSAHRAADQVHGLELERVDEGEEVGARVPRRRREIRHARVRQVGSRRSASRNPWDAEEKTPRREHARRYGDFTSLPRGRPMFHVEPERSGEVCRSRGMFHVEHRCGVGQA